ncbi:hypothetical protein BG005_005943 [Podila minutissima]|nr:hypothetical protein BG005_005943 [Podila minutissima]
MSIPHGPYYVVWCMSLSNMDPRLIKNIRATSVICGPGNSDEYKDEVDGEEASFLIQASKDSLSGVLRLRIPSQVWVTESLEFSDLNFIIELEDPLLTDEKIATCFVDVHFVELVPASAVGSNETPLKREQMPLQTINIPRPTKITSAHVNVIGTFAATLSYLDNKAYVEIWTLTQSLIIDSTMHQTPVASFTFPVTLDKDGLPPKLDLTLSHDASRLAIFPSLHHKRGATTAIPDQLQFRIFEFDSSFTPLSEHKQRPPSLKPCIKFSSDSWLRVFAGAGKFHHLNLYKQNSGVDDEEHFVASDGYSLTVYNTSGRWTQLLSISLAVPVDPSQLDPSLSYLQRDVAANRHKEWLQNAIAGIHGRFFAWSNASAVTIWDLGTCTCVSVLLLESNASAQDISFSPDGSMVAVTTIETVYVFVVQTGTFIFKSGGPAFFARARFVSQGRELLLELNSGEVYLSDPLCFDWSRWRPLTLCWPRGVERFLRSVPVQAPTDLLNADGQDDQVKKLQVASLAYLVTGPSISVYDIDQYVSRGGFKAKALDADQLFSAESFKERRDSPFVKVSGMEDGDPCTHACITGECQLKEKPQTCKTSEGLHFELELQTRSRSDNGWDETVYVASLALIDGTRTTEIQRTCHTTRGGRFREVFFLPCRTRYVIYGEYYVQVWSLPATRTGACELLLIKGVYDANGKNLCFLDELSFCGHGRVFCSRTLGSPIDRERDTVILQPQNQITPRYGDWCLDSVHIAVVIYNDANESHRKELLKYLSRFINYFPDLESFEKSVLGQIALKDRPDDSSLIFKDLLHICAPSPLHWIPRVHSNPETNPIAIMLDRAQIHPRHLVSAATLIEYCLHQAKQRRDVGYLAVVYQALPKLVELHPDLAMQVIAQSAYVPVGDSKWASKRDFVVDHALLVHPPKLRAFWKANTTPIYEAENPVFQVRPLLPVKQIEEVRDEQNERFTANVYVAPFELLWYYDQLRRRRFSEVTTWWRALLSAAALKIHPRSPKVVRGHDILPEYLDNPAIIALLEYKWNSYVSSYWLFRFFFQIVYYALILTVSFLQVYSETPSNLSGAFYAIVICSALFLWLEFQQFLKNPKRYLSSPYNYLDVAVYAVPFIVGILHVIEFSQDEVTSDISTRILSFAILIVYLHLLFELRVIASVCYISTIILSVIYRIKFFFIIFAACIFAFSHSFLHLLHAKTSEQMAESYEAPDHGAYPKDFGYAISATYFFMGGRYDPVGDLFGSENVGFHLMMIFYFFLTVILMLNVLIALINEAFSTSDDGVWRGVWLENRLRYIESAENMSFLIPGFRRTHPWFPREVYYTATSKEVQVYEAKNDRPIVSQFVREGSEVRKMTELGAILAERFQEQGREVGDDGDVAQMEKLGVAGAEVLNEGVVTPVARDRERGEAPLAVEVAKIRQEFQGAIILMQEQAQRQQELSDRRLEELKKTMLQDSQARQEEMQHQLQVLTALLQQRQ